MRQSINLIKTLTVLALVAIVTGCASTPQATTDLMTAAGFKTVAADTSAKANLLKTVPAGQLSLITYKGKQFYVQPDVANNRAWVGTPAEYQTYQQLRTAKQISNDNLIAAQMNQDAMDGWGPVWGGGFYGTFYGRR